MNGELFSLKKKLDSLKSDNYKIDIKVETKPGSLKIAEYKIKGKHKDCLFFYRTTVTMRK